MGCKVGFNKIKHPKILRFSGVFVVVRTGLELIPNRLYTEKTPYLSAYFLRRKADIHSFTKKVGYRVGYRNGLPHGLMRQAIPMSVYFFHPYLL